ncbi:MAG: carboxypeptidase-like regulatory domain-containing protein [Isosphaeraceae bacterium]
MMELRASRRGPGVLSRSSTSVAVALAVLLGFTTVSLALITGGEGNKPITDPGWPRGAASIFNHLSRVAWWEGPPFGGGQWHAECRGDARTLNAILIGFSKLEVKTRRVYVHDGEGRSFWINPNREPQKADAARIDWSFTVWQPDRWQRLRQLPADLNPTKPGDAENGPPAELHIYTGGRVRWPEVVVPKGLEVIDERLEAHGFKTSDGVVFEGQILESATRKPIAGKVRLERVQPRQRGGYDHPIIAETSADAEGRWVLKQVPSGWLRVVVEADGYVPRIAGYAQTEGQPLWSSYRTSLAPPAVASGIVTDDAGKPLADVTVRFGDVAIGKGERYESTADFECKTGDDGRFRTDRLPAGTARIWLSKFGHCRPGLGLPIQTPAQDVSLTMLRSARLRVKVDFGERARPAEYIVQIEPEGGSKVGSWGGSGRIDAHDELTLSDIPPGRYTLTGRPNPSSENQRSKPVTVALKGGRLTEVTLSAVP